MASSDGNGRDGGPPRSAVAVAHATPGRTRVRLEGARLPPELAEQLADELTRGAGVREVRVDPRTASVLCLHDVGIGADEILARVRSGAAASFIEQGEAVLREPRQPTASALGRALGLAFRSMNKSVLRKTAGELDLGTITTLAFLGVGAVEVAVKGKLPLPPWFNLAWWSLSTYMTFESASLDGPADP